MQHTPACDDCIVTALLDRPKGAVILDFEQERAVRRLADAGLAPQSRYIQRCDGDPAEGTA